MELYTECLTLLSVSVKNGVLGITEDDWREVMEEVSVWLVGMLHLRDQLNCISS